MVYQSRALKARKDKAGRLDFPRLAIWTVPDENAENAETADCVSPTPPKIGVWEGLRPEYAENSENADGENAENARWP